jgi:hypothetical protein
MINHALFPVLVSEFHYDYPHRFKEVFFESVFDHLNENGYSDELTGHVTIHHDERYKEIYQFAVSCVKQFIQTYNVNPDLFDINIVQSWLNITGGQSNLSHNHADSHISFVYYVHIPDAIQNPLRFFNYSNRHEPYHLFSKMNNETNTWDIFNSYAWQFVPTDGQLMIFPASLNHDTVGQFPDADCSIKNKSDVVNRRISIAGDILLTHKDKIARHMGLQPISNWRKFDT